MVNLAAEVPFIYLGYTSSAIVGRQSVEGLGAWSLPTGEQLVGQRQSVGRYVETWLAP